MTNVTASTSTVYTMHPLVEDAYRAVHSRFDRDAEWRGYRDMNEDDCKDALYRTTPAYAAFNFHYYFPTHYFKTRYAFESENLVGLDRLAHWLRHNPYLPVVDIGCGDGAGSIAIIESVIRLREMSLIDPRRIQIYCIGVDRNPHGLAVYEAMMEEIRKRSRIKEISVTYEVYPMSIIEAIGPAERALHRVRNRWQQPSLSHAIVIAANVNDILYKDEQEARRNLCTVKPLKSYTIDPFGTQLASFYYHLLELVPIDHLHMITIDTRPEIIRKVVKEMLRQLKLRFEESGHVVIENRPIKASFKLKNPIRSFYRDRLKEDYTIRPFLASSIHINNRQLAQDARWQRIQSKANLELAWARARREMLHEAFSDEVEIRLFEHDLESNLDRLHDELEAYAIRLGYLGQTLTYKTPKGSGSARPRGLTWLEEEILMIAIIQVIGTRLLQHTGRSYAYRLSPDNLPERGPTEYLYQVWSQAWKTYRKEIADYAKQHPDGVILKTDIKSYFTRILQDRLKQIIREELEVSARIEWLLEHLVSKDLAEHDPGHGLVQGSIGSGFLANLYLTEVDDLFSANDGIGRRLYRYVDDIVVVVPNKDYAEITSALLESTIQKLDLEINRNKSRCIPVRQFLPEIASDEALDASHEAYEELLAPIWRMDKRARQRFSSSMANDMAWWKRVGSYRACLIELGIFVSLGELSRKLISDISKKDRPGEDLIFPTLPDSSSVAATRRWADGFRRTNAEWIQKLNLYRDSLTELFMENWAIVVPISEDTDDPKVSEAGRRLRFAANRLRMLGLDSIHEILTDILREKPWLLRYQQQLLESLAAQGYSSDIWSVCDHFQNAGTPVDKYMHAIAIRALRFLPRLTPSEWQRLTELMFSDSELVSLTATETWLVATAPLSRVPLRDHVRKQTLAHIDADPPPSRRLLKNYLLILGRIDPDAVAARNLNHNEDPLVSAAYGIACTGSVASLFLQHEPDVLRKQYYSTKYEFFDDRSGGSM